MNPIGFETALLNNCLHCGSPAQWEAFSGNWNSEWEIRCTQCGIRTHCSANSKEEINELVRCWNRRDGSS